MTHRRLRPLVGALLILSSPTSLVAAEPDSANELDPRTAASNEPAKPLVAMIQSPDLQAVRDAITTAGGTITHNLPIISGVGVRLTREQLDRVVAGVPNVERVIDDLDWEPEPEIRIEGDCTLRSGIQLDWQGAAAEWTLYNKGAKPLVVNTIKIEWPASLGALQAVIAADRSLPMITVEGESGQRWTDPAKPLRLGRDESVAVSFSFAAAPTDAHLTQNELSLTAATSDVCETELIPSYPEPDKDSYFAAVSGAALLHANGVTGKGINVAVLDSGLWEEPDEITQNTQGQPRVIARYDAIRDIEGAPVDDDSGHGTHMVSVLARSSVTNRPSAPQPSYRGIAPDAGVVPVKAIGETGQAGFLDLVRGIQWVVENRERFSIRVLNLSFASRPRWPYWADPVNQALMRAWQAGIFITAAAGNEGPEPMTIGSPGNLPYLLTVGAITDSWTETERNDDYIPDFSSRGPTPLGHIKPEIVALGGHIAGIVPPNSMLARQFPEYLLDTGEFVMTGTSQASALVAGLAALVLQLEPGLSNDELKCMFTSTAEPAIEVDGRYAYSPFMQGEGLISVQRAITLGKRQCSNGALDLEKDLMGIDHFVGPALFENDQPPSLPGQNLIISDRDSEKGMSDTRRWGVEAHLQRLTEKPSEKPVNWYKIYLDERKRLKSLVP
ncbi:MAG: S8 family peptidase [Pseudomonadota bacterium]